MPELTEITESAAAAVPSTSADNTEAKLEDAPSDTESEDTIPELEDAGTGAAQLSARGMPDLVSKAKQSRGEKKARKIIVAGRQLDSQSKGRQFESRGGWKLRCKKKFAAASTTKPSDT
ncbi:nascent polypeptide associated complex alpha subunit [Culex quinquefasciatus]|uniref:Nascent polypeptide associated complex alpha subunit n=1 Tax=Culex quinquefasciatus TaxID=7176 RepID=B0XLL7_CULQU|nr:nascent polypeptide associated complex alpha subunit [Culex quinquefasciatus]|eukprot:XP_001870539.1 nascent polypeptide associated complex alpha subunit [Culex quinquefasciatus]